MKNIIFASALVVGGIYYFSLNDSSKETKKNDIVSKEVKKEQKANISIVNIDESLKSVSKRSTPSTVSKKTNISKNIQVSEVEKETISEVYNKNINQARYNGMQSRYKKEAQAKAYHKKMIQQARAKREKQLKQRQQYQEMIAIRNMHQQRIQQQRMQQQNLRYKNMYEQNMQRNISKNKQGLQG